MRARCGGRSIRTSARARFDSNHSAAPRAAWVQARMTQSDAAPHEAHWNTARAARELRGMWSCHDRLEPSRVRDRSPMSILALDGLDYRFRGGWAARQGRNSPASWARQRREGTLLGGSLWPSTLQDEGGAAKDDAPAPGTSIMRVDLDAATSTSLDAGEAQWRAGVNRQARQRANSRGRSGRRAAG
eukprot:7387774-Prymnesium_polylepis.1